MPADKCGWCYGTGTYTNAYDNKRPCPCGCKPDATPRPAAPERPMVTGGGLIKFDRPAAPTVAPGEATEERDSEVEAHYAREFVLWRTRYGAWRDDSSGPGAVEYVAVRSERRTRERAEVETLRALLKEARGCVAVNYGPNEFSRLLHRIDTALVGGLPDATRVRTGGERNETKGGAE